MKMTTSAANRTEYLILVYRTTFTHSFRVKAHGGFRTGSREGQEQLVRHGMEQAKISQRELVSPPQVHVFQTEEARDEAYRVFLALEETRYDNGSTRSGGPVEAFMHVIIDGNKDDVATETPHTDGRGN